MENLRIRSRARVGDHVDSGRIGLIGQVPAIDEDGESVEAMWGAMLRASPLAPPEKQDGK